MNQQFKIHLALFSVALIYGANYSIAKTVMPAYVNPFGLIVIRVVSAALFFGFLSRFVVKEKITGWADNFRSVLCGLFGVAINQLFFFGGLNLTSPIHASLIMVITPVIVLLMSAFLLKTKIRWLSTFGIFIAGTGAILLITGGGKPDQNSSLTGDIYILLNAASYGIYLVIVAPLMQRYKAITVVSRIFGVGALFVVPFGYKQVLEAHWQTFPMEVWLSILFMVAGVTIMAYLLNAWALRYATPTLLGAYIYLQPVLAILIAVFAGKDVFTLEKSLYALLIFIGVFFVSRK
jgi:drug/metabolite transporter (DMT)-like permease